MEKNLNKKSEFVAFNEVGNSVASVRDSGSADRGAALLAAARQCAGLQGVGAVLALARIFGPRGRGMQLSG